MKKCTFIKTHMNITHAKSTEDIKSATIDKNNVIMITSKYIFVKQDGYYETLTDDNGDKFEICFHKEPSGWLATEKTTGCMVVCSVSTRKDCLNEVRYYLNKLRLKLKNFDEVRLEVQKAYELLENKN